MTRWILILVTAALISKAGISHADDSCDKGGCVSDATLQLVVYGGGAYIAATLPFAFADLLDKDHSKAYGVAEAAIHGPLAVGAGVLLLARLDRDEVMVLGALTALHAVLAVNGIRTISRADERARRDRAPRRPRAALAPALVPHGAGLGYAGTF